MKLVRVRDWPVRLKMAALLVIASLIPLGIMAFGDIRNSREGSLFNAQALLAARGDQLAGEIDMFNRGYQLSAERFSRLPNVIAYCGTSGGATNPFESAAHAILAVQPGADPRVRGAAILDLRGKVRLATEVQLIGRDLSYHHHVQESLRGVSVTSDIYLAEPAVGNVPTIAFLAPVYGLDRAMIGVFALWVRATAVWALAKSSNELAGSGSFAVLFDSQGIRIAHTYSDDIVFHPGGIIDISTVAALVAEHRFGVRTRELLNDVRSFPEQFERSRSAAPERAVFRGFAPVNQTWNYGVARRLETARWTLFYMIPEESIETPIVAVTREKIVFAGGIMLVALVAGALFASVILKPIRALTNATRSIAAGDLTTRVPGGNADEIGELGTSFNSMVSKIESHAAAMERAGDAMRREQEAKEVANRELEAFSYSVAHDLRSPLRGMSGFAQILLDNYRDKLGTEGQDCLQEIHQNAVKMAGLIDALLALSRVTRSEPKPELVDLTAVARSIVAQLAVADPGRTVEVQIEDYLQAHLDPQLARILLENLLGNAWKFTNKVSPSRIEFGSTTVDGVRTFFVRDNGAGFDMAYASKLFVPFQRLHATSEFSGKGIGLATVQRIVRLHGGRIEAEGGVNAGATLRFTLP